MNGKTLYLREKQPSNSVPAGAFLEDNLRRLSAVEKGGFE
jgi:hypothetical protein